MIEGCDVVGLAFNCLDGFKSLRRSGNVEVDILMLLHCAAVQFQVCDAPAPSPELRGLGIWASTVCMPADEGSFCVVRALTLFATIWLGCADADAGLVRTAGALTGSCVGALGTELSSSSLRDCCGRCAVASMFTRPSQGLLLGLVAMTRLGSSHDIWGE
jgi:hypothetical protein